MAIKKVCARQVLLWICLGSCFFLSTNAKNCSCYSFHSKPKSWNESQKQCSTNGGGLVSIETYGEWTFINEKLQQRNMGDKEWWIGLRKRNRRWEWVNGRLLTISKWQKKQQISSGNRDCVAMATEQPSAYQGLFKDVDCAIQKDFICEYDTNQPACGKISKDYFYCTGKPMYEASNPVFTGNGSRVYHESSLGANTTNTAPLRTASTSSPQSAPKSDKIGILLFIILFGIILFILTVCFIYVFCRWFYQPGYQGEGKKTQGNLQHEASPSFSHLPGDSYKPENTRFFVDLQQNDDGDRTDESWNTSGSEDHAHEGNHRRVITHHDGGEREANDQNQPIIYAQIHKTQLLGSSEKTENQDSTAKGGEESGISPLVYSEMHKTLSTTPLVDADDLSDKNSFEMKLTESDLGNSKQNDHEEQPKTPKKPPRSHVVVYANLQDLKHKSHDQQSPSNAISDHDDASRLRSKTTYAKIEDKNVAIETDQTSQRSKTWGSRSRWYDAEGQKSKENSDVTESTKDPEDSAVNVAPSSNVIYAKVDMSKKTKNKKKTDK